MAGTSDERSGGESFIGCGEIRPRQSKVRVLMTGLNCGDGDKKEVGWGLPSVGTWLDSAHEHYGCRKSVGV